jgi:hypothetical protein
MTLRQARRFPDHFFLISGSAAPPFPRAVSRVRYQLQGYQVRCRDRCAANTAIASRDDRLPLSPSSTGFAQRHHACQHRVRSGGQ